MRHEWCLHLKCDFEPNNIHSIPHLHGWAMGCVYFPILQTHDHAVKSVCCNLRSNVGHLKWYRYVFIMPMYTCCKIALQHNLLIYYDHTLKTKNVSRIIWSTYQFKSDDNLMKPGVISSALTNWSSSNRVLLRSEREILKYVSSHEYTWRTFSARYISN